MVSLLARFATVAVVYAAVPLLLAAPDPSMFASASPAGVRSIPITSPLPSPDPVIPWQMFGRTTTRTGNSHLAVPISGREAWEFKTDAAIESSPAIGPDGTIYFGSNDNSVHALNGRTGMSVWKFEAKGPVRSSPALSNDATVVYFGSQDGDVYALYTSDGVKAWSLATGGAVYSSPAVDGNGFIYVASDNGFLYCIRPDGVFSWSADLAGGHLSPAIYGSYVYMGSHDEGQVTAFSLDFGEPRWRTAVVGEEFSPIAIAPSELWGGWGAIILGTENTLIALDPLTGDELWRKDTGPPLEDFGSAPAVNDDGTVFWGSPDGHLYAVDSSGNELYNVSFGSAMRAQPVIGDGVVYAVSAAGVLKAIDDSSGDVMWTMSLPPGIICSPSLSENGLLYVGTIAGTMYGIGSWIPNRAPSGGGGGGNGGLTAGGAVGVAFAVILVVAVAGFIGYRRWGKAYLSRHGYSSV